MSDFSSHPGHGNAQKTAQAHRPTLRAYENQVAKYVGMAPFGNHPPATPQEIQGMVSAYTKAYGPPSNNGK